jgi:hypothetical protein
VHPIKHPRQPLNGLDHQNVNGSSRDAPTNFGEAGAAVRYRVKQLLSLSK